MFTQRSPFLICIAMLSLLVTISIFATSSVHADTNLKFQWRFTEGSGTSASDTSGNTPNYPGTLYNGPTWIPGGGISLDGINDYARTNAPIPGSMGVPNQAYTLSASVRVAEGEENGNIIHISNGANGIGWCISMLHIKDGNFRAIGWENNLPVIAAAPVAAVPGEWYSIANTWSPETDSLDLYVNGVLVASTPMSSYQAAGANVYVFAGIGTGVSCNNDQGFFKGDVKDVRIYSRAISEEEAQQNSNEVLLGAPYIDSIIPANNAASVTTTADLVMTFSDAVTAATGTIDIYTAEDDSLFESIIVTSSQITGSSTDTITINPSNTLAPSTTYYVYVSSTAFINTSGTPYAGISASSTWRFTTEQDNVPPMLETVTPVNNATNVPINSNLILTFNEAVSVTSGTIDFYNTVDGVLLTSVSVTSSEVTGMGTDTITIDLDSPLFQLTNYYMLFSAGVFEDLAQNDHMGITSSSTWSFTTAAAAPSSKITITPVSAAVSENGGTQLFTMRLTQPIIVTEGGSNTSTIYLMVDDTNQATLSATSVEWTISSWSESRYVTVTALNDNIEGDESAHIYWVVSTDSVFYRGSSGGITLTLLDDDVPEETDEENEEDIEEDIQRGGSYTPPSPPRISVSSNIDIGDVDTDGASVSGAFAINGGAEQTADAAVTLNFTDIENVTQVAISESPSFAGVNYQTFSSSMPFTLSNGNGTKTVFAKLRSAQGATLTLKDSIVLGGTTATPINPAQGLQCNSNVYLTNAVKLGSNNNAADVRLLEEFLNTYENAKLTVNGVYEQVDFDAVVRWQKKYAKDILTPWGLTKGTGYVYTTSLKKIKEIHDANCATVLPAPVASTSCLNTTDTLRLGMNNPSVAIAQRLLKKLGHYPSDIDTTGYFGSVTETSVRAFQATEGIAAVGFIGPQTRVRLNELGC